MARLFQHLTLFSCAPAWSERDHLGYNLFLFTVGFFIPLCIIVTASLAVMVQLRKVCIFFGSVKEPKESLCLSVRHKVL